MSLSLFAEMVRCRLDWYVLAKSLWFFIILSSHLASLGMPMDAPATPIWFTGLSFVYEFRLGRLSVVSSATWKSFDPPLERSERDSDILS